MRISRNIANYIIKEKGISDFDEQEVIIYGAEVLLSTFFVTVLTLIAGYILGLLHPLWIIMLTSFIIRKTAGGAHSDNPLNCLFVTLISYNLMSFIAINIISFLSDYLLVVMFLSISISGFLVIRKAPLETENKPLSSNQRFYLKKLSIASLLLISVIAFVLYTKAFYLETLTLCLVLLWQSFMMTQLGHSFITFIDKIKEVKTNEKS